MYIFYSIKIPGLQNLQYDDFSWGSGQRSFCQSLLFVLWFTGKHFSCWMPFWLQFLKWPLENGACTILSVQYPMLWIRLWHILQKLFGFQVTTSSCGPHRPYSNSVISHHASVDHMVRLDTSANQNKPRHCWMVSLVIFFQKCSVLSFNFFLRRLKVQEYKVDLFVMNWVSGQRSYFSQWRKTLFGHSGCSTSSDHWKKNTDTSSLAPCDLLTPLLGRFRWPAGQQAEQHLGPGRRGEFRKRLCIGRIPGSLRPGVPLPDLDQQPDHRRPARLHHLHFLRHRRRPERQLQWSAASHWGADHNWYCWAVFNMETHCVHSIQKRGSLPQNYKIMAL